MRAAYRIERWRPAGKRDIAQDETRRRRWAFDGVPAPEMWNRYGMKSVREWLPTGMQTPGRFVNWGELAATAGLQRPIKIDP